MKMFTGMKHRLAGFGLAVALTLGQLPAALALTADETYTVVISQIESDGSLTTLSSTSATADSSGKISFSLSNLPTADETHFVLLQVKDSSGSVVRQGIAPAPGADETNQVGVNSLSDVQADALRTSMTDNNTDDPLAAAFGLVFVRSDSLSDSDIPGLSQMMATAIRGSDGMEAFLLANGVSASELSTFQDRIVYNSTSGSKDLSDYVAYFKQAVDNGDNDDLAKAGGLMGDILIDAGAAAGIEPQLLMAAFEAAGDATGLDTAMASLSSSFQGSVQSAVSGFMTRVGSVVIKKEYTEALSTLGGSTDLITRFNTGVQNFITAQQAIDTQYGQYFMDPAGYLAANPTLTESQVQLAISAAFDSAWSDFQTAIRSSNAEITDMKSKVAQAMGVSVSSLPSDLGQEYDFSGNAVNWPIPQTVAVSWVADALIAGGDFSYTRDTTTVPSNMSWLDSDDDPTNGSDMTRHDFTASMPAEFAALMGLMEDVQIVEMSRYAIWDSGATPTATQRQQARLDFLSRLSTLASLISGTTDGSTAISSSEKQALIKLMMQPSLH
ncbi:hypothetical protein QVG61_06480 [Thiohalobacter sp. IOR34]|uniref:hypothetical protein n=1 Tax=Thiohalobacter sp. IOR34 TaxID=3057176 RepID=UPI0025B03A23|nr:hypothetical protein [Thiohalobacter sp. IOR34]WJW76727.1 hypothetical protein QVG61_06480 [Thiohalobacter sp. IOR34]